jgi:acetyl esterase/lipase
MYIKIKLINKLKLQILIFLLFTIGFNQTRYIDEVFENYIKIENIVYGNAPDLPFWFLVESNTIDIDLEMDMYYPENDTLTNRPVIIFLHSGAFFTGDKSVDDMTSLSISAVKRGYVVANINYRLGLNVLDASSGERAVYRGVQDGSAVVRYLREHSEDYGIDSEKIFMWGSSAGSFIAFHLAYMEETDRPNSTYGGFGIPDLGCINCEGNNFNHFSKPNAIIGCWGAIGNLNYINDDDNIPTLMFHGTSDLIVPFNEGLPFTLGITLPIVYGSNSISDKLTQHNVPNILIVEEGEPHEYWGTMNGDFLNGNPSEFWDPILDSGFNFLYNQFSNTIIGDVNNDGLVNVLDVLIVVNIILEPSDFNPNADFNNDSLINVLDVLSIISLILEN